MATIYEIEYKYDDELKEKGWRNSLICVYKIGTPSGDNLQHALDLANEDGDWSGVDILLTAMFNLKDEDIVFYFDMAGIEKESLVLELQHDFEIIINKIKEVDKYE